MLSAASSKEGGTGRHVVPSCCCPASASTNNSKYPMPRYHTLSWTTWHATSLLFKPLNKVKGCYKNTARKGEPGRGLDKPHTQANTQQQTHACFASKHGGQPCSGVWHPPVLLLCEGSAAQVSQHTGWPLITEHTTLPDRPIPAVTKSSATLQVLMATATPPTCGLC